MLLGPDLVPPHLLLAPRLPAALDEAPLDSRRVLLTLDAMSPAS